MNDRLDALKLFVRVARLGSFSRAGRELGLSQPSASRIIAALEREVGVQLFTRSTRAVVLTEAGTDYLARIEPVLTDLDEANQAVRGTGELRGVLRVGLPYSYAVREVIPHLPAFMDKHPALRINLLMEDKMQDLLRDGVDVALRLGPLPDSSAVAQWVGSNERVLVASPDYLARAGTPAIPAELPGHALIVGPMGTGMKGWAFERQGRHFSFKVEGRVTANVNEGAIAAAIAGLGIVSTGLMGCQAELAKGTLVRVLPDWNMGAVDVHAVFAAGRAAKLSARAFVDHLVAASAGAPPA